MSQRKIHIYESENAYYLRIAPPASESELLKMPEQFQSGYRYATSGGWLWGYVVLDKPDNQVLGMDKDQTRQYGMTIETWAHTLAEYIGAVVSSSGNRPILPLEKLEAEFGCTTEV